MQFYLQETFPNQLMWPGSLQWIKKSSTASVLSTTLLLVDQVTVFEENMKFIQFQKIAFQIVQYTQWLIMLTDDLKDM